MKLISVLSCLVSFSSLVAGQNAELSEILVPSDFAKAEAARLDAQVFKILPRFLLGKEMSYKDEESPLGIRGSGAFYSFTTKLHSYNKIPQIGLSESGRDLYVGFYGPSYGLIADLGSYSLANLNSSTPEVAFLAAYKPPRFQKEIYSEATGIHRRKVEGMTVLLSSPAVLGHTYLLRAISFDEADILVGLNIVQVESDGSMAVVWKKLFEFDKPMMLSMPDVEMRVLVDKIIADQQIFKGIRIEIKDNHLTLQGKIDDKEWQRFQTAYQRDQIRFRGVTMDYSVPAK